MKLIAAIASMLCICAIAGCADGSAYYDAMAKDASVSASTNHYTSLSIAGSASLNPAHGKPGHRCDIPVGQPLNSAPMKRLVFNPMNAITTEVALNPPHGQPHHRCDIAVGKPLNSKPATAGSTPTTTAVATTTPSNMPTLNPKHGQPGHRCDILVGQPLNSKPAK